ncbi:MAG TPA: ATPase [Arenibaculum sp.]|nr:ATPase [Arenibaculum sp.]
MPNLPARLRAGRAAGRVAAAWTILLASAGIAMAQAEHGAADAHGAAAEHGGAGLPQLDPATFAPQLVWLAIAFAVLYLLMSKFALPKVAEVLEERQERITADIDRAQAMRDEANGVMETYEKALTNARTQAQAVIAEAAAEIARTQSERQAGFMSEIASKTRAAEERIVAAKEQALANVRTVASEIAQQTAEKLAGVKIDAGEADAAVGSVIKERA